MSNAMTMMGTCLHELPPQTISLPSSSSHSMLGPKTGLGKGGKAGEASSHPNTSKESRIGLA